MFKVLKGYMRKHVERKVVHPKGRGENETRKRRSYCYCFRDKSFFPDYFTKVNRKFTNCRRTLVGVKENEKEKGTDDTFKTEAYLRNSWVEAFRWSGTLAFGWALSQNFHLYLRRRDAREYITSHKFENSDLHKHLCPHHILKNILLSNVLAQPNDIVDVKSLLSSKKVSVSQGSLPTIGPKTADQALSEATKGVKKVHDETVGELENRLGLRCMTKQRYRKAIIHFAAGSALQNSSATFNLAQCYELGLGTPQDYEKAAKCYHVASNQGNASATYNLAVFYAHGYGGLKIDRIKALQLLESAVKLGEPKAKQVLEQYVPHKASITAKNNKESQKVIQEKSYKEDLEIVATKPNFSTFRLPLKLKNLRIRGMKDETECSSKSSSISTDDGLASEYESSNSSIVSFSGSSCPSELSGSMYRSGNTTDESSSGESSISLRSSDSELNKLTSKFTEFSFGYPSPLLGKIHRVRKAPVADA